MDYVKLVTDTLQEIRRMREEYLRIGEELYKRIQFVGATMPLLPEEEQERLQREYRAEMETRHATEEGLTQAIRRVLRASPHEFFTVAEVRDKLQATGFDFSRYKSNPLAAISTTLNRMAERDKNHMWRDQLDGVATYAIFENASSKKRGKKKKRVRTGA